MKLLAIMRPPDGVDVRPQVASRAAAELHVLWRFYRQGVVRELYSPGGPGAVLVLEAESIAEAEGALSELPLIADGIMQLEVIELRAFAALEMLFRGEEASR